MLHGERPDDAFAAAAGIPILEAEDYGLLELDLPGEAAACEIAATWRAPANSCEGDLRRTLSVMAGRLVVA